VWPVTTGMSSGLKSFRDSCVLVLQSGYCIGALLAILLHLILPMEDDEVEKAHVTPAGRLYDPSVRKHQTTLETGDPLFRDFHLLLLKGRAVRQEYTTFDASQSCTSFIGVACAQDQRRVSCL
jgi:hypothetical protein